MNLFLDTNVVLDLLADRQPFSELVADLFDLAYDEKIQLYISALSYSNRYYILRKTGSHSRRISQLQDLDALTHTLEVTAAIITKSLKSNFKDFEDAIQYDAALSAGNIDAIVTRNGKDFMGSSLPVFTPKEALSRIEKQGL